MDRKKYKKERSERYENKEPEKREEEEKPRLRHSPAGMKNVEVKELDVAPVRDFLKRAADIMDEYYVGEHPYFPTEASKSEEEAPSFSFEEYRLLYRLPERLRTHEPDRVELDIESGKCSEIWGERECPAAPSQTLSSLKNDLYLLGDRAFAEFIDDLEKSGYLGDARRTHDELWDRSESLCERLGEKLLSELDEITETLKPEIEASKKNDYARQLSEDVVFLYDRKNGDPKLVVRDHETREEIEFSKDAEGLHAINRDGEEIPFSMNTDRFNEKGLLEYSVYALNTIRENADSIEPRTKTLNREAELDKQEGFVSERNRMPETDLSYVVEKLAKEEFAEFERDTGRALYSKFRTGDGDVVVGMSPNGKTGMIGMERDDGATATVGIADSGNVYVKANGIDRKKAVRDAETFCVANERKIEERYRETVERERGKGEWEIEEEREEEREEEE